MQHRLLPYTPERDVYRLLGVPPTASTEDIAAACRALARTFHPDRNRSQRATQEMQIVNMVRQVMTDPEARALYDRERARFYASRVRVRTGGIGRDAPWEHPSMVGQPRRSVPATEAAAWHRYLRALVVGVRAALTGLAPPRCRGCRAVIELDDAYCAACGTPRLTGG